MLVASHLFVFILLKIGNCCRSALPDALVQLKKRALYVVVKLAHLYWNKEKQLKVKRNVREGQKYVKVYFLEHRHSPYINVGMLLHLRFALVNPTKFEQKRSDHCCFEFARTRNLASLLLNYGHLYIVSKLCFVVKLK